MFSQLVGGYWHPASSNGSFDGFYFSVNMISFLFEYAKLKPFWGFFGKVQ